MNTKATPYEPCFAWEETAYNFHPPDVVEEFGYRVKAYNAPPFWCDANKFYEKLSPKIPQLFYLNMN